MYVYFDASALVAKYRPEAGTDAVETLLTHPRLRGGLFALRFTRLETAAALAKKVRQRRMRISKFRKACRALQREFWLFNVLSLDPNLWFSANETIRQNPKRNLSAPDALHLAAARRLNTHFGKAGLFLISSDQGLISIARAKGVRSWDPRTDSLGELEL